MLNAELKSRNSIRTWVFLSSRCSRLRWRAEEMASYVEQFGWYANWNGSSDGGSLEMMWSFTTLSKHFIMMGVSATGRRSFRLVVLDFLDTGMMVAALKHDGTTAWINEVLSMSVRTQASWSAHSLTTRPGMLSGPAAFRALTFLRVLCTSTVSSLSACSWGRLKAASD